MRLTHGSPGQAHDHSRQGGAIQTIGCEHRFADKVLQVVFCYFKVINVLFENPECCFSVDLQSEQTRR